MKKFWLTCTMVIAVGINSCVDSDKDLYQEGPEKESNSSNFSTTKTIQANIEYVNAEANVPFLIYDKNPIIESNLPPTRSLDENISPLEGGWTDESGNFNGEVNLPAYVSDVYIVSKAFDMPVLLKGKIENGILNIKSESDKEEGQKPEQ